jgi:RNA polymerase sigma-70 factor (ECF subfamily)
LETSDKKLISLCKAKKRDGFIILFQKYEKFIYKICYHYTVSREDALDLLQEVYIKLYKSIDRFNENQPILPWLKKITVNTCLNFIRGRKEKTVSLNSETDDGESPIEALVASSANVEDQISYMNTKKLLEDTIQELPQEMRMAVILRHIEGMSYDEIARAMSCPVGTVKTYLFRGRRLLKDKLQSAGVWEVQA